MNSDEHYKNLLKKFILNQCSKKEATQFATYIQGVKKANELPSVENVLALLTEKPVLNEVDANRIHNNILKMTKESQNRPRFWQYVAAASVAIILMLPMFLTRENEREQIEPVMTKNLIVPGTDKAVLTLEDGSQIELEKGKSVQTKNAHSNGEKITYDNTRKKKKELVYNYLTIPRGGQFFITLADGTKVWLNSESQLKYPVRFPDKTDRKVELIYGEAYFDVSPSSLHRGAKFKVIHNAQEIEVLGTEFNVKAYQNENFVYTTLVEGKVTVSVEDTSYDLAPNQQAGLRVSNKTISIQTVDVYHEIAWKNGVFSFDGKSLNEIMQVLSRWYDVEVVYRSKIMEDHLGFVGVLRKNKGLENILLNLKNSGVIMDYKINGNQVRLK